jgi:hypothetical protein
MSTGRRNAMGAHAAASSVASIALLSRLLASLRRTHPSRPVGAWHSVRTSSRSYLTRCRQCSFFGVCGRRPRRGPRGQILGTGSGSVEATRGGSGPARAAGDSQDSKGKRLARRLRSSCSHRVNSQSTSLTRRGSMFIEDDFDLIKPRSSGLATERSASRFMELAFETLRFNEASTRRVQ